MDIILSISIHTKREKEGKESEKEREEGFFPTLIRFHACEINGFLLLYVLLLCAPMTRLTEGTTKEGKLLIFSFLSSLWNFHICWDKKELHNTCRGIKYLRIKNQYKIRSEWRKAQIVPNQLLVREEKWLNYVFITESKENWKYTISVHQLITGYWYFTAHIKQHKVNNPPLRSIMLETFPNFRIVANSKYKKLRWWISISHRFSCACWMAPLRMTNRYPSFYLRFTQCVFTLCHSSLWNLLW